MLHHAAFCFAITLVASLVGFGGIVGSDTAITKGVAVVFLVLFFVSLFRLLYDAGPSINAQSGALDDRAKAGSGMQRAERAPAAGSLQA